MLYAQCQAGEAEAMARAMFRRVLTGWAMDLLALRRSGLDRPGSRPGSDARVLAPRDVSPQEGELRRLPGYARA